jgi:hypothetical protein
MGVVVLRALELEELAHVLDGEGTRVAVLRGLTDRQQPTGTEDDVDLPGAQS